MKTNFLILGTLVALFLTGCFLTEDKTDLNYSGGKVVLKDLEIELESENQVNLAPSRAVIGDKEFEYRIKYIANIEPIVIDGIEVQANDIKIYQDRAYIAYNTAGVEYRGALQVVDISEEDNPKIKNTIIFPDKDINSVYYNENTEDIILGGGEAKAGDDTAFISRIPASKVSMDIFDENKVSLLSQQLTSITHLDGQYYFTVGASNGGIFKIEEDFDKNSISILEMSKNDIRDIENDGESLLALYTDGVTGNLVFGEDEIELGEFTSIEHKSTLEYYKTGEEDDLLDNEDGFVFLGMADQGFKIVKLGGEENIDKVIFEAENPVSETLEIASNSVSYDNGFIFWALGEYGFKVLRLKGLSLIDEATGETAYDEDKFVESVGYHSLDKSFYTSVSNIALSANHIVFKQNIEKVGGKNIEKNYLFVASGVGGVNIYNLIQKDEYENLDIYKKIKTEMNKKLLGKKLVGEDDEIISSPDIKLSKDAQITVSFLTEQAGYKNAIGIVIYDDDPQNIEEIQTIEVFENASKGGGGGSLKYGDSKFMGDVALGKNIGVYIDSNGFQNPNAKRFYSITSLNSDNEDHMAMYKTYNDENDDEIVYVIGIEDIDGGGDSDYNDVIILIKVEAADAVGNVEDIPFSGE